MNSWRVAAFAAVLCAASGAWADVGIPRGKCAFIVASRSSIDEVNSYLAGLDDSLLKNAQVVESSNGWYAVSVGVIPEEDFDSLKARRVAAGIVPADSLCSKGTKYTRVLGEDEYVLPVKVDVSDWVPVGPNAPSLAPTGRAPIAFKRPLREGEPVIMLCPKKGLGCQYVDETGAALTDRVFDDARDFADNGLARVKLGDKWGYINTSGAWVVEPKFGYATDFVDNGLADVGIDGKYGIINASGAWVVEPKFDDNVGDFAENGLAAVKVGEKWGYINTSGAWVVEPKFDSASSFADNGLAAAKLGDKWGYVNTSGEWVVEPKFDYVGSFANNGLAWARLGGKEGYVNTNGAWVVEPKFDTAWPFADNGLANVRLSGKWGYIDSKGAWVVEPKFDGAGSFAANGLAYAKLGDKGGNINTSGAWVVEPLYDNIAQVAGGLFRVDYGNSQYQGLLKPDGTPLTFTQEEFRMAEIEGNQKRLEEELAKKDEEIKRLQEEAANAQAQAAETPQPSAGACDHVYVGRRSIMIKDSGFFGMDFSWDVIGVGQDRATLRQSHGDITRELPCSAIPY